MAGKLSFVYLFFFVFAFTLTQTDFHISPFGTAYYGSGILSGVLVLISGFYLLKTTAKPVIDTRVLVCYGAYAAFCWAGTLWSGAGISHQLLFLTFNGGLLLAFTVIESGQQVSAIETAGRAITLLAIVEGCVCLLQWINVIPPLSPFFKVTGTLGNPNLPGMFLAMSMPLQFICLTSAQKVWQRIAGVALGLSFVAILLLECRTAILGIICGAVYLIWNRIPFKKLVPSIRLSSMALGTVLLVLITIPGSFLQHEGRAMIWNICLDKGLQEPFSGYGIGSFEREYNLAQAAYFEQGSATPEAAYQADFVKIAYNDYIQNFMEGGCVGVLLFAALLGAMLWIQKKDTVHPTIFRTVKSGVIIFAVMACFNGAQYAIPVFPVLMLHGAWLGANGNRGRSWLSGKKWQYLAGTALMATGASLTVYLWDMERASRQLKTAAELIKSKNFEAGTQLLDRIEKQLYFLDDYWYCYGSALYHEQQYERAIEKFARAYTYSSDPKILLKMAGCNTALGKFDEAIPQCKLAMNMVPSRLFPKYTLMNIYIAKKDTINASICAESIVRQVPKGISKDAGQYKDAARKWLNSIHTK